jgi:hypothetical protein
MVRAARSHDKVARVIAVVNLGTAGPNARPAIPVLEKMTESDPEPSLRESARQAIEKIKKGR